jgi:energy-coupling factor transport system substrate-specific component
MMGTNWGFYTTLISMMALALLMFSMEKKGELTARQVSLIAVLAALCAAGRAVTGVGLLFLQPTMFLVEITGFVYGARMGFFVGVMTPLISNFFMGQGPWTPCQMLCWGMVGVSGAVVKVLFPGAWPKSLPVLCFFLGLLLRGPHGYLAVERFCASVDLEDLFAHLGGGF